MESIILWVSVGLFALAVLIGLVVGLSRGLKRSALHLLFFAVSIVVSFLLTKTITNAVLGITLPIDDGKYTISEYIMYLIEREVDISSFETAGIFIENIPNAIVAPIIFIVLTLVFFLLFDIAYLITARLTFGKKKEDFQENKPYRAYGGLIGMVEGIFMIVLLFAPLSSLTSTYNEIIHISDVSISTQENSNNMRYVSEVVSDIVPKEVNDAIIAWDKSVLGKLTEVFGLDNGMFDYLSSFKIDGENIQFRKELTNILYAYDDIAVVYNLARSNQYSDINFSNLRASLNEVMDGNFFRTVIADSFETFITDYETVKTQLNLNFSQEIDDLFKEMSLSFSQKEVDTARYLKQDINRVLDTFDVVFTNDLITKYNNLEDKKFTTIMEFISQNNSAVGTVATNVVSLNFVDDAFDYLLDYASTKFEGLFENTEGLVIALNKEMGDKSETIDDILAVVDDVTVISEDIDLSKLFENTDILDVLTSATDIDGTLIKLGKVFDEIRNLDILVLPAQEESTQPTYVFDNILKTFDIELLGDEVYLSTTADEKTKLDTYEKFFTYLAEPIDLASEMGILDIGKEGVDFDSVLDNVLIYTAIDETSLSRIITPFYQLSVMDLKASVFDEIINQLQTNVSILNFDSVKAEDDYFVWVEEFNNIAQTLNLLNSGAGEIEGSSETYIKYLISDSADLEIAMKALLENNRMEAVLDEVFSARVFGNLTSDLFTVLDDAVKDLTGTTTVGLSTDLTNLSSQKQNTIDTLISVLDLMWNNEELTLQNYGTILDLLKTNASNGGQKNGVLNNIFVNVIWYLTGDDLTEEKVFSGLTPHENAEDIKAYLDISDYYAEDVSYESLMAEIDSVLELQQNVDFTISETNTPADVIQGIADTFADKTEEEKISIVENLTTLLENKNETLLNEEEKSQFGETLRSEIASAFADSPTLIEKLETLFGI